MHFLVEHFENLSNLVTKNRALSFFFLTQSTKERKFSLGHLQDIINFYLLIFQIVFLKVLLIFLHITYTDWFTSDTAFVPNQNIRLRYRIGFPRNL